MDDMIVNKLGFWRGFVRCEKGEDRKNRVFLCRERECVFLEGDGWMTEEEARQILFLCVC